MRWSTLRVSSLFPVILGLNHLNVLPDLPLALGIAEEIGRMIGRHEFNVLICVEPAAQPGYALICAQERLSGESAQSADDLGLHQSQLFDKVGLTCSYLFWQGIPVFGRTALQNVGDVDF